MNTMQKGFTLIELMIVVAIIAILAAIAIPAYQDYVIRSQVSEGASLVEGSKTAVAEFYSNTGNLPSTNTSAGVALSASIVGSYVKTVQIGAPAAGVITATFSKTSPQKANTAIDGKTLIFSPITHAGSTQWTCTGSSVPSKYLPSICRP